MLKIGFTGGSITAGAGWKLPDEQDLMWTNLVHRNCFLDLACVNSGRNGASTFVVFKESLKLITDNTLAYLICSWLTGPRHHIEVGFEQYTTSVSFSANSLMRDIVLNTGIIYKKTILKTYEIDF